LFLVTCLFGLLKLNHVGRRHESIDGRVFTVLPVLETVEYCTAKYSTIIYSKSYVSVMIGDKFDVIHVGLFQGLYVIGCQSKSGFLCHQGVYSSSQTGFQGPSVLQGQVAMSQHLEALMGGLKA
jgi:hypothetical protein